MRRQISYYAQTREALREALRELPQDVPLLLGDGAFYALLDISSRTDDPLAYAIELLEAEDVVVVPGTAFGPSGKWFWRLSYAAGPDTVREGLHRITRFLG